MSTTDDTGPALSILGGLLPRSVVLVETDALSDYELHEEERRILDTTRPKRRAEFYAGRDNLRSDFRCASNHERIGVHDVPGEFFGGST